MHVSPSNRPRKVILIGGGIAGAATAWALSQDGKHECVVLERESQLGAHSTAKNASILRTCTGHRASTQLALETAVFLAAPPPGFSPLPLVDPVGLILIPSTLDPALFESWRQAKKPGSVQMLGSADLRKLVPAWAGATDGAFLVRDEGHIDTSLLFDCFVRAAKLQGTRFLLEACVQDLLTRDGRVTGVRLASGREIQGDCVVIAAGGWAQELGQGAGSRLALEPRRRHLLVTGPDPDVDRRSPILWSEPDAFYMRPESGGLMLCACDQDAVHPDRCQVLPEVVEWIAQRTTECLPRFGDAPAAHCWAGIRTFADDEEFAVGFDPDVAGLFWVAGLGGHGMSTSVAVARLAARLLDGAPPTDPVAAAVAPARFAATSANQSSPA